MLHDKRYYIFYDFPKGDALRETKIPLHKDKNGIPNLDEDEVKNILKKTVPKFGSLLVLDNIAKGDLNV